jgi:hypothetical protein
VSILLPSSLQCTLNVCQSWISGEMRVWYTARVCSPLLLQAIQQVTRELLASTTHWNTGKRMPLQAENLQRRSIERVEVMPVNVHAECHSSLLNRQIKIESLHWLVLCSNEDTLRHCVRLVLRGTVTWTCLSACHVVIKVLPDFRS